MYVYVCYIKDSKNHKILILPTIAINVGLLLNNSTFLMIFTRHS